jgi:hypothetical protein
MATPEIDRFAANGLLFDRYMADCGDDRGSLLSLWTGEHAVGRGSKPPVLSLLRGASHNRESLLISDSLEILHTGEETGFSETVGIELDGEVLPEDLAGTQIAKMVAIGLELLEKRFGGRSILWLHYQGLAARWDAPLSMRGRWQDDEAIPVQIGHIPPRLHCRSLVPDEILSWIYAYADQVGVIGPCLEPLWDAIDRQTTLVVFVGTTGMSLGEHGWIGPGTGPLLSPRTHLPLVLQGPGISPLRSSRITQPHELGVTIREWLAGSTDSQIFFDALIEDWVTDDRERVGVAKHNEEWSMQTLAWHWYRSATCDGQLFSKPDDRFDINDVRSRAISVHEEFAARHSGIC